MSSGVPVGVALGVSGRLRVAAALRLGAGEREAAAVAVAEAGREGVAVGEGRALGVAPPPGEPVGVPEAGGLALPAAVPEGCAEGEPVAAGLRVAGGEREAAGETSVREAVGERVRVVQPRPPRRATLPGGQEACGVCEALAAAVREAVAEGCMPRHSSPKMAARPPVQLPLTSCGVRQAWGVLYHVPTPRAGLRCAAGATRALGVRPLHSAPKQRACRSA